MAANGSKNEEKNKKRESYSFISDSEKRKHVLLMYVQKIVEFVFCLRMMIKKVVFVIDSFMKLYYD